MEETIHGTTMPVLELSLAAGESIVSEAGEFSWMSDAIQMQTNTGGGMGGKGIMGAVKRAVSGASFMMTTYTAQGGAGSIAFASKFPGHILPIDVAPGNEFMVHRHGFMAATQGIELSMGFQQSFRGGIFGGEGFILQKIGGTGRAFVDLSGEVIVYDLAAGPDDARPPRPRRPVPGLRHLLRAKGARHGEPLHGVGRPPLRRADGPGPYLAAVDAAAGPRRRDRRVHARPRRPPRCRGCCGRRRSGQGARRHVQVASRPAAEPADGGPADRGRRRRRQETLMGSGGTVRATGLP